MKEELLVLEQLRLVLESKEQSWEEKKMFGGFCFMVDGKMCFGIYKGGLMLRVGPDRSEELSKRSGAEQMIHGGRAMNGYLWVAPEGFSSYDDVEFWVETCLDFNPLAKASKKKTKKPKKG